MRSMIVVASFALLAACGGNNNSPSNEASISPMRVQFAADNNFDQYDSLTSVGGITKAQFEAVIAAAHSVYDQKAKLGHEELKINDNWDDKTVNANCMRSDGVVEINMYGGLARRVEVGVEGFALVLCHELSHAYGGIPYIQTVSKMSAEGQADYAGAKDCLKAVLPVLESFEVEILPQLSPGEYAAQYCGAIYDDTDAGYSVCVRQYAAAQSLGNLLATLNGESVPNFETPDPTVVKKTLTSYPATTQCRLDTYNNGIQGKARPKCWFNK